MDSLTAVRMFAEVVDRGSFSAAARALGVATSSVSRQVHRLEDKLGARLLDRTTRRVKLTPAGTVYYERIVQVLQDVEEAGQAVSELEAAPRGLLRLNIPMTFGKLHVLPLISEFLERYPEVNVDVSMTDTMVDLVEAGADLAIRIGELKDSSLVARRLAPSVRALCASPRYLERHGEPRHPADLAGHACLLFKFLSGGSTWSFEGPEGSIEVRVRARLLANNAEALLSAAINGHGLALLPTWLVAQSLEAGSLRRVLPDYWASPTGSEAAIYAVYPHRRHLSPRVRAFIDLAVERFSKAPWSELRPHTPTLA